MDEQHKVITIYKVTNTHCIFRRRFQTTRYCV